MISLESVLLQYIISQNSIVHDPQLLRVYNKLKYQSDVINEDNVKRLKKELDEIITQLNIELDPIEYKIIKHRQYTPFVNTEGGEVPIEWSNIYYCYINCNNTESVKLATVYKPSEMEFVKYIVKELSQPSLTKQYTITSFFNTFKKNDEILKYKYMIDKRTHVKCGSSSARKGEDAECYTSYYTGYLDHLKNKCDAKVITFKIPVTKLVSGFKANRESQSSGASSESSAAAVSLLKISDKQRIINKLCEDNWLYKDSQNRVGLNIKTMIELKDLLYSTSPNDSEEPFQCQSCQKMVTIAGINCSHCNEFTLDLDCIKTYINKNNNELKCSKCNHALENTDDILYIL